MKGVKVFCAYGSTAGAGPLTRYRKQVSFLPVKATIDIPDDLYRRVKVKTAEQGRKIRDVTIELFQTWLAGGGALQDSAEQERLRVLMMKHVGCFDSGVDDLGSNPKHLEGLGEDSLGHR